MEWLQSVEPVHVHSLKDLGALIRGVRKQRGLTQEDVMFAADVSKTFVVDVEAGKPSCQFDKVLRVAQVVGVKVAADGPGDVGDVP